MVLAVGVRGGIAFLTPAGQRQRGPFARQRMVGRGRNHRENRASGHPDGLLLVIAAFHK